MGLSSPPSWLYVCQSSVDATLICIQHPHHRHSVLGLDPPEQRERARTHGAALNQPTDRPAPHAMRRPHAAWRVAHAPTCNPRRSPGPGVHGQAAAARRDEARRRRRAADQRRAGVGRAALDTSVFALCMLAQSTEHAEQQGPGQRSCSPGHAGSQLRRSPAAPARGGPPSQRGAPHQGVPQACGITLALVPAPQVTQGTNYPDLLAAHPWLNRVRRRQGGGRWRRILRVVRAEQAARRGGALLLP